MAIYTFNGTENVVIDDLDIENDLINLEGLEASDIATVQDTPAGARITTTSGVTLTIAGFTLAELGGDDGPEANFFPFDLLLLGDSDDDYIYADSDAGSVIVGLDDEDDLYGDTGDDLILGNQDDDYITGNGGSDRLFGGQGDDTIYAVGDFDTDEGTSTLIYGGLGEDTIYAGSYGFGPVVGSEGDYTIYGGNGSADADDEDDVINVALNEGGSALVYGNGGDDEIIINGYGDAESGYGGFAYGGDVTVYGGQGDDLIVAGTPSEGPFGGFIDSAVLVGGKDGDSIVAYG
ncbi:MAG TPA: hypothetical protein VFE52_03395, partial [Devosia sp.]|nr:hypothetical protein [Devosia sp.]